MSIGDIIGSVGKGFFAGLVGTGAMTISSTVEMKLSGRKPSSAPVDVLSKLGIEPEDKQAKQTLSNVVHWSYGTMWGGVRGILGLVGLRGLLAILVHVGLVWGTELIMLPGLKVTSPVSEWGAKAIAIDAFHHIVYTTTTSLVYDYLH